jgi:hypothetical protein
MSMNSKDFDAVWMDNRHVSAERRDPKGYPHACEFEVAADWSRIVRRVSTTFPDDDTEDAKRFIKEAGNAVEVELRKKRGGI